MNKKLVNSVVLLVMSFVLIQNSQAKETTLEKAETVKNKSVDSVKSNFRKVDDKMCEMVNGKMNCMAKKVKNKVKNTTDKIETEGTETINKVD
jgi:hypothetical protein